MSSLFGIQNWFDHLFSCKETDFSPFGFKKRCLAIDLATLSSSSSFGNKLDSIDLFKEKKILVHLDSNEMFSHRSLATLSSSSSFENKLQSIDLFEEKRF